MVDLQAMHRPEEAAWVSVARGCGFAALAIVTFMFGMAGNIPGAFKAGGILTLITSLILLFRGWQAPSKPYKRTEVGDDAGTGRPPAGAARANGHRRDAEANLSDLRVTFRAHCGRNASLAAAAGIGVPVRAGIVMGGLVLSRCRAQYPCRRL